MKRILLFVVALFLTTTVVTQAAPVSWDFTSSVLRPLQSAWSSEVRVPYITATSTATNTLPVLNVTSLLRFNGVTGSTWSAFCTSITGSSALCDGDDATGGGGSSISTSSVPSTGQLAFWTSPSALSSVATGTLTETVSGLQLDATRGLVGGSAVLSLTSGFEVPLTASTSQWSTAFGWGNHASAGYLTAVPTTTVRGMLSATAPATYSTSTGVIGVSVSGDWTGTFDGQEGTFYLSRANHTGTQLASTISDLTTTVRGLISSTATGLTYTSGTGVFSLTSGFNIPLTASTSEWAATRASNTQDVTLAGAPNYLSIAGQTITRGLINLASHVTGVLGIGNGGTGTSTTPGVDQILVGNGTGFDYERLVAGTNVTISTSTPGQIQISATGGGAGGLATTTPWNIGEAVTVASNGAVSSVATGTLTTNATGLQFNNTRGLFGGAAVLSLAGGYVIPLTASTSEWSQAFASTTAMTPAYLRGLFSNTATGLTYTSGTGVTSLTAGFNIPLTASTSNWESFYLTPSTRITAGANCSWAGNTFNCTGSGGSGGLATTSPWTIGQLARVNSSGAVESIATSALAIALGDTTGTLAPTRGGTGVTSYATGDLLFATAANTLGIRSIGSTGNVLSVVGGVPTWVATSTLGLGGGGGGSGTVNSGTAGQIAHYAANGTAVSGTSTIFIDSATRVGIGTTTPTAGLSIVNSTTSQPIANFSAESGSSTLVVNQATSTVRHISNIAGFFQASLAQISIGIDRLVGYYKSSRFFGALTVAGLIFQEGWNQVRCDNFTFPTQIATDANLPCGSFSFYEDTTATMTGGSSLGVTYTRMATAATADGAGMFLNATSTGFLLLGTSTPVFEATARIHNVQNQGTTTQTFIGFTNITTTGTLYEVAPTAGCFFTASTTQANWRAICRRQLSEQTNVDTGIASTTVTTGDSAPYRFLIEADADGARFFIQTSEESALTQVANITTNIPTSTPLNAGVHFGRAQGLTVVGVDLYDMNVGWRKLLVR